MEEFNDIFEDSLEGIFEDFHRVKELAPKNSNISNLLKNENLTFVTAILRVLKFRNIFILILYFVVVFLLANKFFAYTQNFSFVVATTLVGSILSY